MKKPPDVMSSEEINKMNIVGIALEMLFLPLSAGVAGALLCAWQDRRHAHTKVR